MRCPKHLVNMSQSNDRRCRERETQGLCLNCGVRPQFWSKRCIVCRERAKRAVPLLPPGLRHALRLYREHERKLEIEQRQHRARIAIEQVLKGGRITGLRAAALRLYAGLDSGKWRSYREVGELMNCSGERVRQLLYPSKIILTYMLGDEVPWRPLSVRRGRATPWRESHCAPAISAEVSVIRSQLANFKQSEQGVPSHV